MESLLENKDFKNREAIYGAALEVGLPIVSRETCAIICAMLLVWGNHENFTHHHRLVAELRYAQKRFNIQGAGAVTDKMFKTALDYYVSLLELNQQREDRVPDFIDELFQERYGFHFNK